MFICALTTSLVMIPPMSNLAVRVGGIDRPDERKVHNSETPRLGGIAIFCAFLFSTLFFVEIDRQVKGFMAGAVVIFLTGLADDITNIKPIHKLLGEIIAAVTAIISGDMVIKTLGHPLGFFEIKLGFFAIPFTVFAVVGVMNAINLIDGLDGLAGGVSAIACLALAALSWKIGNQQLLGLIVAVLGSILGFLCYNTYPATIFMGDSGSLFLGYCMGFLSVLLLTKSQSIISPITPLIILGVPILDTLVVMVRRLKQGKKISSPDKTHIHHRLLDLGFGHKFSVLLVYGVSYILSAVAVICYKVPDHLLAASLVIFFIVFYAILHYLTKKILLQDMSFLQSDQSIGDTQAYRRIICLSRHIRLSIKYLLVIFIGLSVIIPPTYPTLVSLMASLLIVFILIFFFLGHQWSNLILQVVIYLGGALIIFAVENYGYKIKYLGYSLTTYSHAIFVILCTLEGFKIFLRKRTSNLMSSPFEYFIFFVLISISLIPVELTNRFHLLVVAAESIAMFVAYKLILTHQTRNNRKILLATFVALAVIVVRYVIQL